MPSGDIPSGVQVTYSQQYRRCGKAACARCAAGGRGHGPYWYAKWWADGQARSHYVGRHPPAELGAGRDTVDGARTPVSREVAVEPLRVRTMGDFTVWRGTTLIPPEGWRSRRSLALFKCLLSTPGHRLQREQAIELLWPEAEPGAGATSLRSTVYLLRQVLDGPHGTVSHLRTEGDLLVLAPAGDATPPEDWLDATVFASAAHTALAASDAPVCRSALACYHGEYLPGDSYLAWAEQPRMSLRQHHLDLLMHLATLCAAQSDPREAEECLRQVLAIEPSHEGAAATLMGIMAASGRRAEALQVYHQLATVLEEELDVEPATEIMALRAQLQAQEAAPLAASSPPHAVERTRPTNLPMALTSFVGRVWEQRAIGEVLARARLVTLTGPGGAGKTRLALEVAGTLIDGYPDGVWLVELAALADTALVPRAVAAALGVTEQAGRPMLDTLGDFLRPRNLLLLLDNCEHLTAGCAEVATVLLHTCPRLRLLATSREGLEVAGEHTYRVPSLAVPDPDQLPALEQLSAYEAVRLFVERAQARRPEFALTTTNARAVAQICARLDGLPLAIELAAARVSAVPIDAIAVRLDDRFRLLTGGPRTALPRQQTLRATMDWSYELLDAPEQVLWRRLAVFAGGWTLEAAEEVCADGTVPHPALQDATGVVSSTILDLLEGLVNKSLVVLEAATGDSAHAETRYRMLETIRQYGLEKLAAAGGLADVRGRHLAWYVALGEQAEPQLRGRYQLAWLDRLERENDNLRAALQWSTTRSDQAMAGLRLAGAIGRFWNMRGHLYEGRRWLAETLANDRSAPGVPRARALYAAASLAHDQGDDMRRVHAEEALRIYRAVGDLTGTARVMILLAWWRDSWDDMEAMGQESLALARQATAPGPISGALILLSCVALGKADLARSQTYAEESLAISRGLGDRDNQARALEYLGEAALRQGHYTRASTLYEQHLSLQRELGSTLGVATAHYAIGETAFYLGETSRAVTALEAAIDAFRTLGHKEHLIDALEVSGRIAWHRGDARRAMVYLGEALALAREMGGERIGFALRALGTIAYGQGEYARAVALHRESLVILREVGLTLFVADSLEGLAVALGAQGQVEHAGWLLGSAEAAREDLGTPIVPPERVAYARSVAMLRGALGEDAWTTAWAAGRATPIDVALTRALATEEGARRE